jgi:hypothetical protein
MLLLLFWGLAFIRLWFTPIRLFVCTDLFGCCCFKLLGKLDTAADVFDAHLDEVPMRND